MKKSKSIFLMIVVLFLATLACNATLPQTESITPSTPVQQATLIAPEQNNGILVSEAQVPRISVEDAKIALDSGDAIIVDVRSPDAYATGHVEGAINIPLGNFETDIANVPLEKNQWIISYCT